MTIQHIAAFSDGDIGGNPAGVLLSELMLPESEMQSMAKAVGYSESVFAAPYGTAWRVRYFSPEREIPFCGHATIALGAALAARTGEKEFKFQLNDREIEVAASKDDALFTVSLQSPETRSSPVSAADLQAALDAFALNPRDLLTELSPSVIHAGADHLMIALASRKKLAAMRYDFGTLQLLARERGWVTVLLCHPESKQLFHVRNAFAYGGVYEDPATGAAAAALAGHLRQLKWLTDGSINIRQGDDMGVPCRLSANIPSVVGGSVRVTGTARYMHGSADAA